jgi:hypothetical protein
MICFSVGCRCALVLENGSASAIEMTTIRTGPGGQKV